MRIERPPDFVADLKELIERPQKDPPFPGFAVGAFRAYRQTGGTVFNGGVIVNDAESFDPNGWHNTSSGRYTPQRAGYYRLTGYMVVSPVAWGATFWVGLELWKNGARYSELFLWYDTALNHTDPRGGGSDLVFANGTTDYFELRLTTNWGGGAPVVGGANGYFCGERIGL